MKDKFKNIMSTWLGTLLKVLGLMLAGELVGETVTGLIGKLPFAQNDAWKTALMYASNIGLWTMMLIFYAASKKDRELRRQLGTHQAGNTVPMLLLGFLAGGLLNAACAGIACLNGNLTFGGGVNFNAFSVLPVLLCVFIQSSGEELICRNYMYGRLLRGTGRPILAIIGNTVFFAALHLLNPGITALAFINLLLYGLLASLIVWSTGSMWMAFSFHTMWNFTQNIIFGLPNSGQTVPYSIMAPTAASNSWAYDTGFGIEGSLLASAAMIAACAVFYLIGRKKGLSLMKAQSENTEA